MVQDRLSLLWAHYERLDRIARKAEEEGEIEKLERAKTLLAHCAQLIAELQSEHDS